MTANTKREPHMSNDLRNRIARAIDPEAFETHDTCLNVWERRKEAALKAADAAIAEMGAVRVVPLVWEYHPAGKIAAPPTGHAYIIDTRMKGRVHSIKGFNPQREFVSLDEAKAAAQADYEARILAAIEPAPSLRDEGSEMKLAYDAYRKGQRDALDGIRVADPRVILSRVRAIAEGKDDE